MQDKIILGLLADKNLTVYEIKKRMEENTEYFYSTSLGSIHPATQKLLKQGFVSMYESIENGRAKKTYQISDSGKLELEKWLKQPISLGKVKEEVILRTFFFSNISKPERVKVLQDFKQNVIEKYNELKKYHNEAEQMEVPENLQDLYDCRKATLDMGVGYYNFLISWLTGFISQQAK